MEVNKKLAENIAKQGRRSARVKDGKYFDTFGHEVQLGYLVVTKGAFATNIIEPVVITKLGFEKDIPEAIMVYNPYKKQDERTTLPCVMKIFEPEKYLK